MTAHSKNLNIAELVRHDIDHHFHPFTDHKSFHAEGGPRVITHADGVWIWDANGNKLLDGMAGLWCVNVGYGRKELAEAAYRQMLDLPYYNTFFKTTTVPSTELAAKISSVMPHRFKHIFFVNSGSEANDTIVRFVRHYWKLKGKPYRNQFIGRRRGYHGSTIAAASLGGMQGMHEQGGLPLPGFHHVQQPYWYDFGGDLSPDEFGLQAAAGKLSIEVDEGGAQHWRRWRDAAERWRPLGVRLGIDNTGRALEALADARSYGVDYLKVDGRFIRGLAQDTAVADFARQLVVTSRAMGVLLYAEGVDDLEDLRHLWQIGFDGATGPAVTASGVR